MWSEIILLLVWCAAFLVVLLWRPIPWYCMLASVSHVIMSNLVGYEIMHVSLCVYVCVCVCVCVCVYVCVCVCVCVCERFGREVCTR